ncbi:hypothetical protein PVAND_016000 [Polypedilum vanderplanki]|uniref:Zinc finger protein n=1 Tax=Polypedilum vanderplanki TaxID=319348 RepID=A0A9J6BEX5_POLVA|nr:hypothetical protein PVAND_016000 [Polypedilum vanderplanki]
MVDRLICRGCLIPEGQTKHSQIYLDNGKTANDIFNITNLIILNFSENKCQAVLCQECNLQLRKAVSFREMMRKNDKYFKTLFDEGIKSSLEIYFDDFRASFRENNEDDHENFRARNFTEGKGEFLAEFVKQTELNVTKLKFEENKLTSSIFEHKTDKNLKSSKVERISNFQETHNGINKSNSQNRKRKLHQNRKGQISKKKFKIVELIDGTETNEVLSDIKLEQYEIQSVNVVNNEQNLSTKSFEIEENLASLNKEQILKNFQVKSTQKRKTQKSQSDKPNSTLEVEESSSNFNDSSKKLQNSSFEFEKSSLEIKSSSEKFSKRTKLKEVSEKTLKDEINDFPNIIQLSSLFDHEENTKSSIRKSASRFKKSLNHRKQELSDNESTDSCESYDIKDEQSKTIDITFQSNTDISEDSQKQANCKICGKNFSKKLYLKQHMKSHMELLHRCVTCGKKFATQEDLNEHVLKHFSDKPFKCHFCQKSFNYKSDMNRHLLNHTQNKPFKCDLCNKTFARKDHMIKHEKIHERKICKKNLKIQ